MASDSHLLPQMEIPKMTNHLLIIDPQNDFCDIPENLLPEGKAPALAVPGAHADMLRLATFLVSVGQVFDGVTVTLDSHPYVAVERTTMWLDENGKEVAPFTEISLEAFDAGKFRVRYESVAKKVRAMLAQLNADGKALRVWPVHCVTGTWGHNIHNALHAALCEWELSSGKAVKKVLKGEYPLAEHFGVFEAETPVAHVESTRFNNALADALTYKVDRLFIAGEAGSHCVAESVRQLIAFRGGDASGIVLLVDCMSPVAGCESAQAHFIAEAIAAGAIAMTFEEAISAFGA